MKKKLLGHCAVDSGQLILVDPSYLAEWNKTTHYDASCDATLSDEGGGPVLVAGIAGTGVAVSTGWGDGNYPVHGHINDEGRVVKVEVDFSQGEEVFNRLMSR